MSQLVLDAISRHQLPALDLRDRKTLVKLMRFLFALIVAAEPLIEEAIKRSSGKLRAYYIKHLEEERGHCEWLAEDLASMGITETGVDWQAAQIAGTQYYLVKHSPPESLLGYMAALECRSTPMSIVEELEQIHGKQAIRTFRHHAEHDINHGAEVLRMIDMVGNERGTEQFIAQNADLASRMLCMALA